MNGQHDPELDDLLQDIELRRIAALLGSARQAEPPLDDAFRSDLRRQLMHQAWTMSEGKDRWWRRAFRPPTLAWMGAAAGVVLIASVVLWSAGQPASTPTRLVLISPIDGNNGVALQQPILVAFNQKMDHQATQAAVRITPATTVTYSWNANTLAVQPTSGALAPNTQYKVTIGPGARTAAGQPLTAAQTITFVTQPPATPSATPTPQPTPVSGLGDRQLARVGGSSVAVQWSADSSTVYFVTAAGALDAVSVTGGPVNVLAPSGVTSAAMAPAGDRLAYIRGGKIETKTFATGATVELAPASVPVTVGWAQDKLVWASKDGIYLQTATVETRLAPLPATGRVTDLSIAPDGTHVAYHLEQNLVVLDLGTGKTVTIGQAGATFAGWSPDGTQLIYSDGSSNLVTDVLGNAGATLAPGDVSWSDGDSILIGGDTGIFQVRPDASSRTKLADGTYRAPVWAPNATTFAFFRAGSLWIASAPPLPPEPTTLDQAAAVVKTFMQARLDRRRDDATKLLDDGGKQAYAAGGLSLLISGDPAFSRYYILTQELIGTTPDTARIVVRLVLTHHKLDVSDFEETLTVTRDSGTREFLIDQAEAAPHHDLGKGAEVIAVDVAPDAVKITFDSDLDPATIAGGVALVDANGQAITVVSSYGNRTVTLSGVTLKAGALYRLEILTGLRDVSGQNVPGEYTLDLIGPVTKAATTPESPVTVSPSPSPASPSPSPASPTPTGASPTASPVLGP